MKSKVKVAVVGFGLRARDYTKYQIKYPGNMEVVAIAEKDTERLKDACEKFGVKEELAFSSADELLSKPKLADAIFITTQDKDHVPQALKAIEKGYDILIEKPISPDLNECIKLLNAAKENKRMVTVCHVMRYTPFFDYIKKVIDSGKIGEIRSVQATENVGYYHQAHSFVRGNWRRSDETSPMILAKSCHDMDLIQWLIGKKCLRLSSFGSLSYFKEECAPAGSTARCLGGCQCKEECPYDAEKIYVTDKVTGIKNGIWQWPCNAVVNNPTVEKIYEALRVGPYGRCVFRCDNDVVDNQVVNMEFEDKVTASFIMSAFTTSDGRQIKIMGTLGDIIGDIDTMIVKVTRFGYDTEEIDITTIGGEMSGHAGGDLRLVENFIDIIASGNKEKSLTSIEASVHSHVMALAAEKSRKNKGLCIELDDLINFK